MTIRSKISHLSLALLFYFLLASLGCEAKESGQADSQAQGPVQLLDTAGDENKSLPDTDEIVARVNEEEISKSEVELLFNQLASMNPEAVKQMSEADLKSATEYPQSTD